MHMFAIVMAFCGKFLPSGRVLNELFARLLFCFVDSQSTYFLSLAFIVLCKLLSSAIITIQFNTT